MTPGSVRIPPLIAVVSWPPPLVGQSLASRILVEGLRRRGALVEVVSLAQREEAQGAAGRALDVLRLPAQVRSAYRRLGGARALFYLQVASSLRGMLRDLLLLEQAARLRLPVLVHVHCAGYGAAFVRAPAALQFALRRRLRRVGAALVITEGQREELEGVVPPERIHVLPNGVEPSLAEGAARWPPRERPGEPLRLLFLSNLLPFKGYATVLRAARLAQRRGLALEFWLAGPAGPWTVPSPEAFVAEHGLQNVRILGGVYGEEKLALLRRADVLLLPSRFEVQPLVLLEAMHFGLPVVASRRGGMPETLGEGLQRHLLVEPDRPEQILERIAWLLAEPGRYERLSRENVARARGRFVPEAHVASFERVARTVASSWVEVGCSRDRRS